MGGNKYLYLNIIFSKKVKVKLLDEQGVAYYSNLDIPELHDKFVPQQAPVINNIQPYLQSTNTIEFNYWVNGEKMPDPTTSHQEIYRVIDGGFGITDVFKYQLQNLKVGSTLVFEYTVEVPYRMNWQHFLGYRVFFHGVHPKMDYSFLLTIPKDLMFDLYAVNGAVYDRTEKDGYIQVAVNLSDMNGGINESGARPHLDLPHLTFYPKPYEWQYCPYDSHYGRFMPFHISMARGREWHAFNAIKKFETGTNEPSINATREFIDAHLSGLDSVSAFLDMHNEIVEDFEFLDDRDYLAEYDTRKPRVGEHLASKKFRNINRFDSYRYLFAGLKIAYNTMYVCDNRRGRLGEYYLSPMKTNDYIFLAALDHRPTIIYPKKSKLGYYANELPFYFENTKAVRIAFSDIFLGQNQNYRDDVDLVTLPWTPADQNSRKIFGQISLAEDGTASMNYRVSLSGQYSSCGRHPYRNQGCDHTINPQYCEIPLGAVGTMGNPKIKITKEETVAPYNFGCNVSVDTRITSFENDELTLSLEGLFTHVIDEIPVVKPRSLPYYADFAGTDIIGYQVQLDGNYELVSAPDFSIENAYGKYVFQAQLNGGNTLQLNSAKLIYSEVVQPDQISQVIAIQDAVTQIKNGKIVLKKL